MGRHETFENAVLLAETTFLMTLPAPGSPEAMEAFGVACRAVDAASRLSDAEMEALHIMPGGASLWTSDTVTAAQNGDFSRFAPREIEAARATPRARLEEMQILALRRELRMAEAARSSRIRELHALVYGDDPDPDDGSEAPAPIEPDPILALIEARAQALIAYNAWADLHDEAEQKPQGWFEEEKSFLGPTQTAYEQMISTVPTTATGRLALLDRLRVEMSLHGMADGFAPEPESEFWGEFFGALRHAVGGPSVSADDAELIALGRAFDGAAASQSGSYASGEDDEVSDIAGDEAEGLARRIAALPARTIKGMRAKLRVAAFYRACDPGFPAEEGYPGEAAIRSLYRDTPGIEIGTDPAEVRIVPETSPTITAEPDPHVAYRDRLITAMAERWCARAHGNDKEPSEIERRAYSLVWDRLSDLIEEISALPPPKTPQGLGVLAIAAAAQVEGAIGKEGNYRDEVMAANIIRGALATTGTQLPPIFIGFGDEPDFTARESVAFFGPHAFPGWALAAARGEA